MNQNQLKQTITLKDGSAVPRLGQGTWYLGQGISPRTQEIAALRRGIELGMTLIDTAEMYGEGKSEQLVGEAISGTERESLFLVSKVYPWNAGKRKLESCLDQSLKRLGTDYLDLYLLHWRGSIPLRETAQEMERMVKKGKIRRWGVSNLDIDDMQELMATGLGEHCMVDQVLYHLASRGTEFDLQPWLEKKGIAMMAYCPIAQGGSLKRGLYQNPVIRGIAEDRGVSPAQVLLNFVLQKDNIIAIPKASSVEHVEENAAAFRFSLNDYEMELLDGAYPAPKRKTMLDMV